LGMNLTDGINSGSTHKRRVRPWGGKHIEEGFLGNLKMKLIGRP